LRNSLENLVSQEGIGHRGELEERSRVMESSLRETNRAKARLVSLNFASWNRIGEWLRGFEALQGAA
jgi:hypothetical protein